MSRVFVDDDLLTWEAYASGGRFGLPEEAKVVFHCRSDPIGRARYVQLGKDNVAAEQALKQMSDGELRALLRDAQPLD
jgi:hypothetical protein